jgi:hypothetical protein
MGSGASQTRPSLRVANGDAWPDPVMRLSRFRLDHPDVKINWGSPWEAQMTEPDGAQRWVVRYEIDDLLDEVERRLAAQAPSLEGTRE